VIKIENVREFPAHLRGGYFTIGNFDGVHRGHQRLIARLRAKADAVGVPAVAITFNPHPVAILRPDKVPVPLVWPEREVQLLKQAGAGEVGVFQTGDWLLSLSARDFFDQVVRAQLGARGLVEGPNFAFGRDRRGDVKILSTWCGEESIDFEAVEPLLVGGRLVSSSRIRQCLDEGKAREAAELLGQPHRVRGIVTHGAARGRGLGFPTANLDEIDTLIPLDGVYAARAWLEGEPNPWPVACNIGPNPTFGEQIRKVEAHLIDYDGDLYGRRLELDFLDRIRETRRFEGLDDLLGQIRRDVDRAGQIFQEHEAVKPPA
jgi:riboflavin kinase/FMN adenylyltransferase